MTRRPRRTFKQRLPYHALMLAVTAAAALRLPRREVARYVEPPAPPSPYVNLLDEVLRSAYADYRSKAETRAAELAEYGLGLAEVEYGAVSDPADPTMVTFRGVYRIVPLNNEETR